MGQFSEKIVQFGDELQGIDQVAIGLEIRKLRKARNKTIAEISSLTGRSISFISQLERGRTEITISDLKRFAHALGVSLGWFFLSELTPQEEKGRIVRADGRRRIGSVTEGLVEELLSPDVGGKFETFIITIAPGATLQEEILRDTEDEGYLMGGQLNLWIAGVKFSLNPGDSFRIVHEPFRWENPGEAEAKVVWVIAPPIY